MAGVLLLWSHNQITQTSTCSGMARRYIKCRQILEYGFDVGCKHAGSKSSPPGIWGTDDPGHSFGRAPEERLFFPPRKHFGGWDVPVALRMEFPQPLKTHRSLVTGRVLVAPMPRGTRYSVGSRTQIWLHKGLYERFIILPSHWAGLLSGQLLACRARRGCPWELYASGMASPMTCARACRYDDAVRSGWQRANATKQWRCFQCDASYALCRPCTDNV